MDAGRYFEKMKKLPVMTEQLLHYLKAGGLQQHVTNLTQTLHNIDHTVPGPLKKPSSHVIPLFPIQSYVSFAFQDGNTTRTQSQNSFKTF